MLKTLLFMFAVAAGANACAGESKSYEGECGGAKFRVVAQNNGHPLDNKFTLSVGTPTGSRNLFTSGIGGWFHAACLPTKRGKPLLVFQSYCGGSACLEGNYGAADPASFKLLLRPSAKNVENDKKLRVLLGAPAPHLGSFKEAFCCGDAGR